jgi:hypothetical protein
MIAIVIQIPEWGPQATAKDTNRGRERTGNDGHGGYTPSASLYRTHPVVPVASSQLFLLGSNSFRGEQL